MFTWQPVTVSQETHVFASLFVMFLSGLIVLFGVGGLTTRLDIDDERMLRGSKWFGLGLDIPWASVEAWGIRVVVEKHTSTDETGCSWEYETRHEYLEIVLTGRTRPIRCAKASCFFEVMVVELRTRLPLKERLDWR
jgi:hypothetical protein